MEDDSEDETFFEDSDFEGCLADFDCFCLPFPRFRVVGVLGAKIGMSVSTATPELVDTSKNKSMTTMQRMIPFISNAFCFLVARLSMCDALGAEIEVSVSAEVSDFSKNKSAITNAEMIPFICSINMAKAQSFAVIDNGIFSSV